MDSGVVAALSDWLDPAWWWSVAQMILGLGAVIFVHELGHFLAAKFCGVKAEKFYVGFDAFDIKIGDRVIIPRKLVHFQWGETEYGVGILPLGGYVKMLGQDDNPGKMAEEREKAMSLKGDGVDGTALDPRSYMAKTVPQRMLIISAGVIMNLIFSVIFAMIAFRIGVNFEPTQVGATIPGSPAWQNSLEGSTVVGINDLRTDDPDRYFTFNHLREVILMDSHDGPIRLDLLRPGDSVPVSETIEGVSNLMDIKGAREFKSLGIEPMLDNQLGDPAVIAGQAASRAEPALKGNDRIVEINGMKITNGHEMRAALALVPDKDASIVVERNDSGAQKKVDIVIPPNPQRGLGLVMQAGPVHSVRKGSPAEIAGLKAGDTIEQIDGQPVGNPFTLQLRMLIAARENRKVSALVRRAGNEGNGAADSNTESLEFSPILPASATGVDPRFGRITIESLGINLAVTNRVETVEDPGSPLKPGDEILSVQVQLGESQRSDSRFSNLGNEIDLSKPEVATWPLVDNFVIQMIDPGTKVAVRFRRGEMIETAELEVREMANAWRETRGIVPRQLQTIYQNDSTWAAFLNGLRQTRDDATRVLKFLKKLVRGDIAITSLGGPGTIVLVATSEASQGTSRLLLFLTLLGANLAIVNFLPIPVLDGGHMVFLLYEGIFRKPVGEKLQVALTYAGLAFLVLLMITVIGLDIWRFT